MSRPPALRWRCERKPPDQPSFLADATEDDEATEDEVVDAETTAETKAEIAMTIKNTPALTVN
jgi:hypothetical protein